MNPIELKIARMRRKVTGKEAATMLGITIDGYFKKEQGSARITLEDALALTKLLNLSFSEFATIFFDGNLPLLYDGNEDCKYANMAHPLKMARLEARLTELEAAAALGISVSAYKARERGRARISLEQCAKLSALYKMTLADFNTIFFRSLLSYRNSDLISYGSIVTQNGGEINGSSSNNSGV